MTSGWAAHLCRDSWCEKANQEEPTGRIAVQQNRGEMDVFGIVFFFSVLILPRIACSYLRLV